MQNLSKLPKNLSAATPPLTMISASKIQNRCPGCRAQLLGLYEALLFDRTRAGPRPFLHSGFPSATTLAASRRPRPSSIRQFSSSRTLWQDQPDIPPASESRDKTRELKAEDSETIVRQARQTFGHTLPAGFLSDEEYKLYVRLYGPPLRETRPEDVGIPHHGESGDIVDSSPRHNPFEEQEGSEFKEVKFSSEESSVILEGEFVDGEEVSVDDKGLETLPPLTDAQIDYLNVTANNQREYAALMKLQRDFEAASLIPPTETDEPEIIEERPEEEDDVVEDENDRDPDAFLDGWEPRERAHPNTLLGAWGTNPSTIYLPKQQFVQPISGLLERTDMVHLKEAAKRIFGGTGLPHSPATPKMRGPAPPQKGSPLVPGQNRMSPIDADTYIATVLPGVYASVMSSLVEVRKRLGPTWIRGLLERDGGPRVLDVGGGGAGLAAWQEVLQAEWGLLHEHEDLKAKTSPPPGKRTVVIGSDQLRHRVKTFLHDTTFLPRLPDYLHSVEGSERQLDSNNTPAPRKRFDIIIASHTLMATDKEYKRKDVIDNLWAMLEPNGGVLIVLEKGHPRGFEAVANVRMRLLEEFIVPPTSEPTQKEMETSAEQTRNREPGMIIAPCTNHTKCPLYLTPGLSPGRKDFCHFNQRFIRPPFLQRILGFSHCNHEDIKFSFVAVRRGAHATHPQGKEAADRAFAGYGDAEIAPPNPLSLPRNIKAPLKRHGHVTFEVCTPAGAVERWVVPKSFSKQAFRDARKAQWGDLWALGAKTRTRSNIRLGRLGTEDNTIKNPADGGVRSQRAAEAAKRKKDRVVNFVVDPTTGTVSAKERFPSGKRPAERRTKGGRRVLIRDILKEAGIDEMEEEERKRMSNWGH